MSLGVPLTATVSATVGSATLAGGLAEAMAGAPALLGALLTSAALTFGGLSGFRPAKLVMSAITMLIATAPVKTSRLRRRHAGSCVGLPAAALRGGGLALDPEFALRGKFSGSSRPPGSSVLLTFSETGGT